MVLVNNQSEEERLQEKSCYVRLFFFGVANTSLIYLLWHKQFKTIVVTAVLWNHVLAVTRQLLAMFVIDLLGKINMHVCFQNKKKDYLSCTMCSKHPLPACSFVIDCLHEFLILKTKHWLGVFFLEILRVCAKATVFKVQVESFAKMLCWWVLMLPIFLSCIRT